jgi:hypothetical protein
MRLVKKLENKTMGSPQFKILTKLPSHLTYHSLNRQTNTSEIQTKVQKEKGGKGETKTVCDQRDHKKPIKAKSNKKKYTIGLLFTLLSLNINKQNKSCLIDLDISKL